jgi:glycosyltransferase involved in cell wall biosynthesis
MRRRRRWSAARAEHALVAQEHTMPKVSIAVPTYNCESYIAQSLESLLGQTYSDFELVISDNCSTDGTEDVCRTYAARDKRVRYVRRTENIGGPGNFRYVFSLCSGQYHKWSTADDYWHPSFLEEAVKVLDADPNVVLCYPRTRLIDAQGATLSDHDDKLHLMDDSPRTRFRRLYELIGLCNAHLGLIRRDAMLKTSLIAAHKASDVDFLGEMALLGKFHLLPDIRFYRRFHEESSSWARKSDDHQKRYYDPSSKTKLTLDTWRRLRFQWAMVWRSPIGLSEKLALSSDLARWTRFQRVHLSRELWGHLRQSLRGT